MKPFAHWAIHKQQKIRIATRRGAEIHGELVGPDGLARPFVYDQQRQRLTIGDADVQRVLLLDDYGFEQEEPVTSELIQPPAAESL